MLYKFSLFFSEQGRIQTKITEGRFLTDTYDIDKNKNINFVKDRLFI